MPHPRVLIEQWLPIDQIGAECMRERGASSALPPLYFLHVWWARRPLTVSRAAILASLLPAYPSADDENGRAWPEKFLTRFPTFDAYKGWFLKLIGITGNPAASRKIIDWAKTQGIKLTPKIIAQLPDEWKKGLPSDMGVSIPYGYPRAFTYNPKEEQLETLYELLEWTWGTREITFCDPMAGGGTIPFEAIRFGLTVHANELNPVASVILKATLDYPARFGPSLAEDIRKYGKIWSEKVHERLEAFYPLTTKDENVFAYLWARTVACPVTGKLVPLSPNWWLRNGSEPIAVRVIATPDMDQCNFEIVEGTAACKKVNPDRGTIKRGTAISPWTGEAIDGDYIKAEAQAGRMGEQLYAVRVKTPKGAPFRLPTDNERAALERLAHEYATKRPAWEGQGLIPIEPRREGRADWACEIYGATRWCDTYSPRQLVFAVTAVQELHKLLASLSDVPPEKTEAVTTYLYTALSKAVHYNSRQSRWHSGRDVLTPAFQRHDLSMRWSFGEMDGARNLLPWAIEQTTDAYDGIAKLVWETQSLFPVLRGTGTPVPIVITQGTAQRLQGVPSGTIKNICVDPPYYDNVMYAECSNFFYVWMKRCLGSVFPEFCATELANEDDEAVMNAARFKTMGRKAKPLAIADYENKMQSCFSEMNRMLSSDGILTVMFTHKEIDAWDTLGSSLIRAGFRIDASWPIHTESEHSLHQAKKNAAAS
jgi:adenine-specific DNA methylase